MSTARSWLRRLWYLVNRRRIERDLEREMAAHRAAMDDPRRFGNVTRLREEAADVLGWTGFDDLRRDVVYAARILRRAPAFSVVIVVTLALGIGANTAIFSVVNGVLLQPLPYDAPDRQVRLQASIESRNGPPDLRFLSLSVADTAELAQRTRVFDQVGNVGIAFMKWPGRVPQWSGAEVTASVFPMLGVRPALGRLFLPDDEVEGAPPVLVLSFGAWQRHFAGDPGVIGQTIALEPALGPRAEHPTLHTIVGIAPAGFDYLPGADAQYWIPLSRADRGAVVARLADAVSTDKAAAEIAPILRDVQGRRPGPLPLGYSMVELQQQLVAPVKSGLLLLMGAVGFVLLIACVNVASLLLVRSSARSREMAIRAAIGASHGRLLRQTITESLLLTTIAAIAGIGLASGGVAVLRRLATTTVRADLGEPGARMIPRLEAVGVDGAVLALTCLVAAAVALLFGIVPALHQRRLRPIAALRGGPVTAGTGAVLFRGTLVVAEVALSIVLLVGSGLLISSLVRLLRVDVGYDPAHVLTFQVSLPSARYPASRQLAFAEDLATRLASQPTLSAAAYANQLPLVQLRDTLAIGRTPDARPLGTTGADVRIVSRTYFETMRIALKAGRTLEERDAAGQPAVLVINEALARRDFGGIDQAVGRQAFVGRDPRPWTIVGVVADVRQFRLARAADPQFFLDARQWREGGLSPLFPLTPYYTVRFEGDANDALAAVSATLKQVEPEGMLFNVAPMGDIIATTLARPRLYAVLLGGFAAVGVIMAVVGIYGVLSYAVSQRTRELGIRMALGARRAAVFRMVLRHGLMLTAAGILLGLLGAAALSRTLETMLFGLTPLDPPTFAGVALLFAVFAALAAYMPARRATLVDPLIALRNE